jgi:hypothetical protein
MYGTTFENNSAPFFRIQSQYFFIILRQLLMLNKSFTEFYFFSLFPDIIGLFSSDDVHYLFSFQIRVR